MNKFNFEPVGWLGTENCQPKFISSAPCQIEEEIYGPFKPLHTDDQLAEAYDAGKRDAIPEGYVLVPKEPTEKMLTAMSSSGWLTGNYKAMLTAAPKGEWK